MRIEDLDGPRVKRGADREAMDVLAWLGIDWDEGPTYQRQDLSPYWAAMHELAKIGAVYPCRCTRTQIESAQSAPHGDEHELRYPGTCRGHEGEAIAYDPATTEIAWRVYTPDEATRFTDLFAGAQTFNIHQSIGDFVIATKAGLPAYQLAVVVDDAAQRVTHIVRGDDLISSTPRQMLLRKLLGIAPEPEYYHLPLVLGEDGRRLAKRHGDTRVVTYRQRGVTPERIIGLMAHWCGGGEREPMSAATFMERFEIDRLPHEAVTYTQKDEQWLMQ